MHSQITAESIYTANLHLTKRCNLRCKFCYARFTHIEQESLLPLQDLRELILKLKESGCMKLNFAGGEPLLHPHLGELIVYAYRLGLKTSIVTNGTLLNENWLERYGPYLHWVAISCDSAEESVQKRLGRGKGNQVEAVRRSFEFIKRFNVRQEKSGHRIRTKLNSVITRLNWKEDMSDFAQCCGVKRWKIFQVLFITGENEDCYPELAITIEQFNSFIERHLHLRNRGIAVIPESNDAMLNSYVMIDPQGRFYQNANNAYTTSQAIVHTDILETLRQVGFSEEKFMKRGGLYDF